MVELPPDPSLSGPPLREAAMTVVDVERIESQLAALPADYREFLLRYPSDAPDDVRRCDLYDDPAEVVEQTLVFRRYLAEETPRGLVVIGDGGCGDKVCLDLDSSAVLFWSHVEEDFVPLAESVGEYYAAVVVPV